MANCGKSGMARRNRALSLCTTVVTVCVSACGTTDTREAQGNAREVGHTKREIQTTVDNAKISLAPIGVVGNTLCLNAGAPGQADTYQRIERVFGTGAVESPSDTQYTPTRPHVLQRASDGIVGPHFAILAIEPTDVNQDLVTIQNGGDRSRTEIKIAPSKGGMHDAFKPRDGDTFVYSWRFKIAPGMKFSPSFTHIHQIKAYGGVYADPPVITFTPLGNGSMQVRHIGNRKTDGSSFTVLAAVPLAAIVGQWISVRQTIRFSNSAGRYQLSIRDQTDREVLSVNQDGLEMWRDGAEHMRPKWGIYRRHHAALNQHVDDYLYVANLGVTRGSIPSSSCR